MHFATPRASGRVQREARYNEGMRVLALLPIGGLAFVTGIAGAACGGSAFTAGTAGSGDGGTSSSSGGGSSGGGSGSGSGSSSGASSSSGGGSGGGSSSGGSSGSGGSGGTTGTDSGASGDGGFTTDAAGCNSPPTKCGSMTCSGTSGQQGDICCVDPAQSPIFSCASCDCGCSTQLECAVSADCTGTGKVCCIEEQSCGSGSTHWVSSCKVLTSCGGKRLCNPNGNAGVECVGSATASCTTNTSSVGIPSGTGYGYCD